MSSKRVTGKLQRSDLKAAFEAGFKPSSEFSVGLEYERFGILTRGAGPSSAGLTALSPNSPLPIDGPVSVTTVLEALIERHGWHPKLLDGRLIELSHGASRITLEPGGQMELSGGVHKTIVSAAVELGAYLLAVKDVSEPHDIRWLGIGTHPTAQLDQIPWLPKRRYELMRAYLPEHGRLAHQMMKGTCGAQVNLDFSDEADAMEKLRVAMAISAVVAAIFANSPITGGRPNGFLSERSAVWLETDPDRSGLLDFPFSPSASFDDYVDYALGVPMFFLVRGDQWIPLKGLTFGVFLERGYGEYTATYADWELHLTTLFPDVRLKSYIEVRGTDSNTPEMILAHAALWKGIFYGGPDILAAAYAPLAGLEWQDRLRLRSDIARFGLRAEALGRPLLEIAPELIEVAEAGLRAAAAAEDAAYLEPIRDLAARRRITPAEDLLDRYRAAGDEGLQAVVDHVARLASFE